MGNRYDYTIPAHDVDGKMHFRLVALQRAFLTASGKDADLHGFGTLNLIGGEGISWVLLKFAADVKRLPVEQDKINIETWVEGVNRLLTTRNFIMRDAAGEILCTASTEWAIIDLKTRRPVNVIRDTNIADFATGEKVSAELPGKLPQAGGTDIYRHRVVYSDIDYNGHTNSMQYVQWIMDSYPVDKVYDRQVERFEIVYAKEAVYGEDIEVRYEDLADDLTLFSVNSASGTNFVNARIKWKA
ncbi:MAG: hypothetical protein J6T58_05830 [Bacteroidales bacterium]|nr:hypothetical protein [Bacteroidales bacterium]